jgi:hypothetical protein
VDINPMLVTEDSCLGLDALIVLEKKRSLNRH